MANNAKKLQIIGDFPSTDTINQMIDDKVDNAKEFIFNVVCTDEEKIFCEIDVTAEEFLNAYNSGRTMTMVYTSDTLGDSIRLQYQLFDGNCHYFMTSVGFMYFCGMVVAFDDIIYANVIESDGNITIGNQVADGGVPVDFTDTINQMIDDKIPETLKNPESLTINGIAYDGSEEVSIDTRKFVISADLSNVIDIDIDGNMITYGVDTTADEIRSAYQSGRIIVLNYDGGILNLITVKEEPSILQLTFCFAMSGVLSQGIVTVIGDKATVGLAQLTSEITIDGETWAGIAPVDFTDTINQMIDYKISSGEYITVKDLSPYAKKSELPTNVSQLTNDAGYLTEHQDLSEYAKRSELPTIPTNVSYFANDAGYLTEHQDLTAYAKKSDVPTKVSQLTNDEGYLTEHQDLSEYAKTTELPTKVSQLANDAGYLTEHQDLSEYTKTSDLPTKVSQLANDAGYLTQHQSLENYYTKSETVDKLNEKQDVLDKYVASVNGYSGVVTLTATDIHALPDTTVIPTVPKIVSAFTNDADYATRTYVSEVAAGKCKAYTFSTVDELDAWLKIEKNVSALNNGDVFYIRAVGVPDYWWDDQTQSKQILETTKVDLTDYAKKSSIPINISQLTNDANYITVAGVDTKLGNYQEKLTSYVSSVNGKSGVVSLTYTDVGAMPADTVIPTVPTKVSAFTNDAGYLTQHQSLAGYAKTSDIPTKVSQLTNDAGYLTQHQSLANYVTVATLNALAARVTALETALNGFSFSDGTSAPTSGGAKHITFVDIL